MSKPPPDELGNISFSEESLTKMKKPQLLYLCSRTAGIQGVASKKKSDIIEELLIKLPECQKASMDQVHNRELPALKRSLLKETTKKTPIIDFYNDHYGWLDQIDKDYYKIVKSTHKRTYGKLIGFTILMFFIRNVWALCEERKMVKSCDREAKTTLSEENREVRLVQFIGCVCNIIKDL